MTVTEIKRELEVFEEIGLGDKELNIFIDTAITLPINMLSINTADEVDIMAISTEEMRDFYKNKYDKINWR
jgi:hypothetical protein